MAFVVIDNKSIPILDKSTDIIQGRFACTIYPKVTLLVRNIQNGMIELLGRKFFFNFVVGTPGIYLGVISGNLNKIQKGFKVIGEGFTIAILVVRNVTGRIRF